MGLRRYYVANSIVFVSQVVYLRAPIFAVDDHVTLLRSVMREAQVRYPFKMLAYVFLPDHFHLLFKPAASVTHSQIMHSIKPNFTKLYKDAVGRPGAMRLWQRRYWDHVIRDADDLAHHFDYIHYNPVKHGLVTRPEDWPHSSYLDWRRRGFYPERWGWAGVPIPRTLQECDVECE